MGPSGLKASGRNSKPYSRARSAPPRDRRHSVSATPGLVGHRCRPAGRSAAQPRLSLLEAGEPSRGLGCATGCLAAFRGGDHGKPSSLHLARLSKTCHWALTPGTNGSALRGKGAVHAGSMAQADAPGGGPSAGQVQLSPQLVQELVRAAVAAPSMHNAQPWRFRVRPGMRVIELHADPARMLPYADPRGRGMHIGCGAALFNLRLAAAVASCQPAGRPALPGSG